LSISNELVNRYPWLPSLKKIYEDIGEKPPAEFVSDIFTTSDSIQITKRVLKIFEAAFNNLEEIPDKRKDNLNVHVYLLLKIMLYALNNKIITNRIANLYSKSAYNDMEHENSISNIYDICKDLGLKINSYDPPQLYGLKILKDHREKVETNFSIHYIDYLRLASNLRDEYRKLTNNPLIDGYVFIQNKALIRLIQEYVRNKLLIEEAEDKASLKAFIKDVSQIQGFNDLYNNIKTLWDNRKEEFDFTFKLDIKSKEEMLLSYPPCVIEILKKAEEGQNLVHHERLFIVWFLLALEYPVENVVNIFSTLPDFDRDKTTYQVEYAKRKNYTPYQCSTLKSLGLCMANKYKDEGELCREGYGSKDPAERKELKHPLFYVQLKQYRSERAKEYNKSLAKRELEDSKKPNE
jgi:DNA primase large subunit